MREIRVYGKLAKFLGQRIFHAAVNSPAEAVRFLLANFPAVERHMNDQHYRVSLGQRDLDIDEIHDPAGQQVIKIAPVIAGAGAAGRILAGVALVAGALLFAPGAALAGAAFTLGPQAVSIGVGIGLSLALGGVAQLLTPTTALPTGIDSDKDPRANRSFSGVQNVSRQGVPVPIIYGQIITGSVVISAGIDVAQVSG